MNSGSPFLDESSRMVSSDKPLGMVTDSISVTKPAEYSRSRKDSMGSAAGFTTAGFTVGSVKEFIWFDSMSWDVFESGHLIWKPDAYSWEIQWVWYGSCRPR